LANLFGHVWTCLNKSPTVFCGHISKTCNRKKIKVYSIRKSFFFQLYNNFTISIACDKIEAKKQNFCISSQKYIQQFSSIKYYSRSKYEKYEKKTTTQWKKSQCPPVFKTIRKKNQKQKNTTGGPPLTRKSLTRFPLTRFLAYVRVSGGISVSRGPQYSPTNTSFM